MSGSVYTITPRYVMPQNTLHIEKGVTRRFWMTVSVPDKVAPGIYTAEWDGVADNGSRVASGIYFYKLETELYTETKKMMLLK